jgi:hypothetical protein
MLINLLSTSHQQQQTSFSKPRIPHMADTKYAYPLQIQDDPKQAAQVLEELKATYNKTGARAGSLTEQARQAIA